MPADGKPSEVGVPQREPHRQGNADRRLALHGDRRVPGKDRDVRADRNFGEFGDRADWPDSILYGRRLFADVLRAGHARGRRSRVNDPGYGAFEEPAPSRSRIPNPESELAAG